MCLESRNWVVLNRLGSDSALVDPVHMQKFLNYYRRYVCWNGDPTFGDRYDTVKDLGWNRNVRCFHVTLVFSAHLSVCLPCYVVNNIQLGNEHPCIHDPGYTLDSSVY